MTFDFTNYTFSGLLSILAALYGVGYPLIIQSIERIYGQYDSELLANRFVRETVYRVFQCVLIVNLILAVTLPFVLESGQWNQWLITLQAIILVWLFGQTFMLYHLILTYSNAGALLRHIERGRIDKSNVMDILDLAIYADSRHNMKLYIDCMADVFTYIHQQQGDKPNQARNTVLPPPVYDRTTQDIIFKIKDFLRTDDGHHFLHRNNDIVSALYNQTSDSRLSLQAHQWMWMMLNEVAQYDNRTWFSQYWQFADSYANIKYHFIAWDSPLKEDKRAFMLRHVMIGALLVHHERYAWLNDILFYSHSEPEYYGLVPSTFAEIVDMMEQSDKVCQVPLFQHQNFYFADGMYGIKDEKVIFRKALRYLSLLVIRLWSLKKRNLLHHNNLMALPLPPVKIADEERAVVLMGMMKQDVADWIAKEVFQKLPNLAQVSKEQVDKLLDDYKIACESACKHHREHPNVSKEKFDKFLSGLEESLANHTIVLPSENEAIDTKRSVMTIMTDVIYTETLETLNYTDNYDIDCRCISDVAISNFNYDVYRRFLSVIGRMPRVATASVPRKQIQSFLKLLNFSDEYAIVTADDIDELQTADVKLNAGYRPFSFYLLRKQDMPIVEMEPLTDFGMKPISEESSVCSNANELLACHKPAFDFHLGVQLKVTIPNDSKGIMRVEVDDDMGVQDVPVAVGKKLSELFA